MAADQSLPTFPRPPRRILVVDDVAQVRQDLRMLLELSGSLTVVGEAADGAEAVRQTEALAPDVVLMDLAMPGLDGCEAARQLRENHFTGRIVILTVHAGPENVLRASQAGADALIVKGAAISDLLHALAPDPAPTP